MSGFLKIPRGGGEGWRESVVTLSSDFRRIVWRSTSTVRYAAGWEASRLCASSLRRSRLLTRTGDGLWRRYSVGRGSGDWSRYSTLVAVLVRAGGGGDGLSSVTLRLGG
jgi:hypothetical protein